jgi:hypothetical protein
MIMEFNASRYNRKDGTLLRYLDVRSSNSNWWSFSRAGQGHPIGEGLLTCTTVRGIGRKADHRHDILPLTLNQHGCGSNIDTQQRLCRDTYQFCDTQSDIHCVRCCITTSVCTTRERRTVRTLNHVRQLGTRYHNSCRSLRPGLLSDYDLYITVKRIKKMHQPFHGKPVQPIIHQSRNLRLIDIE